MTAGGWKSTAQGASLKFSRNSLYLHLLNTIVMPQFRNMTPAEIAAVESLGSSAEAWSQVSVADDFTPFQLLQSHLEGKVVVGSGARIIRSRVCNYHIGEGALVEGVTALECRRRSTFGNGVGVATMNECGGRTVKIYDRLSAQAAYLMAVYRHRPQTMAALEKMVDDYAEARASQTGSVGKGSRIVGARFIREVRIGDNVTVDGCSILENGTVCDGAHIGVDVKAYDFIAAENARIDNGSIVERCFVGESCRLDKAFTAAESLFFANSHCENGEAASIFAGPYTVSHHKSSLLIAGMFSFFNAGSGSNQSNHLFKSGAVHQAVHLRGCKFASGAYIMSPALEGAFTMIMGHHSFHHDTSAFPYSYLVEKEGRSVLMPGANLTSYGAVRDIEKWPARDRRTIRRDVINFEEYNPYITSGMLRAVDTLHAIAEEDPDAPTYVHQKAIIRAAALKRGIGLYNRFIVAALGAMLDRGESAERYDGSGRWLDIAGQYITKREVEAILDAIDHGELASPEEVDNRFRVFSVHYDDYAHSWAEGVYASLLGHIPTVAEIEEAIAAGRNARATMRRTTDADRDRVREADRRTFAATARSTWRSATASTATTKGKYATTTTPSGDLNRRNMYTQSITRNHRTAFILAIDGSGSMAESILFRGRCMTKAEAVATITNDLLFELVERARRSDGVRDYYDIAVVGYSGDDEVRSLLPGGEDLVPVSALAAQEMPVHTEVIEHRLPDGSIALREIPAPAWIKPLSAGQTPMCEALRRVRDIAAGWTSRTANAESFPPVVFNITDGEATDCDNEELRAVCDQIKALGTVDGNVLLINIHIAAGDTERPVFFPEAHEARYTNRYASLLYDCSSEMPAVFNEAIREAKGPGAIPPFRGMSYNASAAQLVAMLNIGSISVKTE